MFKFIKLFYIACFVLLLNSSALAMDKFTDFPNIGNTSGDISLNQSEFGKTFVKVAISSKINEGQNYTLVYKIFDTSGKFLELKTIENFTIPEFNVEINSLNGYEFCIVTIHDDAISSVTPIQKLSPGDMILNTTSSRYIISRDATLSGVDLVLDIDAQSFPYINLLAEITTNGIVYDGTQADYPILDANNFEISEDTRFESIDRILPPDLNSSKKIVDIVFVHDDSGSLDDEAAQVRTNIQTFLNDLANADIDYRIGLLPYGGGGTYSDPSGTLKHSGNLHDNAADLIADIDSMRFDGGTENAFDALNLASSGILWRTSTQKVIILITDEPDDSSSISESAIISTLQNNSITVYGLTAGHIEFNNIADATGGSVYNITAPFESILTEIGADIVSKYIIRYETDNTAVDGVERTVNLKVKVDDGSGGLIGGEATGTYTPNPPIEIYPTPETETLSDKGQRDYVALDISAKIIAGVEGDEISATLFYRNQLSTQYESISMSSIGSDLFTAQIPALTVQNPYVEYYITASNGTNTYTYPSNEPGSNPIVISVLPNISPDIQSVKVSEAKISESVTVSALVEDVTNQVVSVSLFYREQGSNVFTEIISTVNTPSVTFSASIPASSVTENGLEYYIDAVDDFGVHSTYGSSTDPFIINVSAPVTDNGSKDLGNITVYADSFVSTDNNVTWTASGHVTIAKKLGNKILSVNTSVILDTNTNTVTTLSGTDIVALAIKRSPLLTAVDMPLYNGGMSIDCSANPPVMELKDGTSTFRPISDSFKMLYPAASKITIKSNEVIFSDIYTTLTSLGVNGSIKDLVLSQVGNSSQLMTLDFGDALKFYKVKNSIFELQGLALTLDFVNQSVTGSGFVAGEGVFGKNIGGIGGTLGFVYSPYFELNTLGGKIGLSTATQVLLTFPTTPPSPFGVRMTGGSMLLDGIATGQALKFSVTGDMKLADGALTLETFEKATGYQVISGSTTLLIDTSGKVVASGDIKLLEHLSLASAALTIGNPSSLAANVNIVEVLTGRLFLQLGSSGGFVEMIGQSDVTVQIPPRAKWIGGMKLANIASDTTFRFNSSSIDMAEIRLKYQLFFAELGIRLDISNIRDPHLWITGFNQTVPVFSKPRTLRANDTETVSISDVAPYVFVKITSNDINTSADFNITLPDGTTYTPQDAVADASSSNINTIFFMQNPDAQEAYYAIKDPSIGDYILDINNANELGGYSVELIYPNDKPEIAVTDTSDVIWDGNSSITISWVDKDDDNNAKIDLYYSKFNSGNRGTLIVTGILEDNTTDEYQWTPSAEMQSGEYYIFAKIDDGEYSPVFSYGTGKVIIENPNAPATPQNVIATALDGAINVSWDSASDANITYRVFVTQGDEVLDFASGGENEYSVYGLKNNTQYTVNVQAKNSDGYVSLMSDSVYVTTPYNAYNEGGSPDLTIDTISSKASSENGKLKGVLNLNIVVKNIGEIDSSYAKVNCYYGNMEEETLIGSKPLGAVIKDGNVSVEFSFDISSMDQNVSRTFYIRVDDVVSSELNTFNNVAVFKANLSKVEDLNEDYEINIIDVMKMSILENQDSLDYDLNNDGVVDDKDTDAVKELWGTKY